MPRTRHATDPTGQAEVTRSHQRAKSSTILESRLELPSTTLGDSATRLRSRTGKRKSTEHSRESPCDWLSELGRVDQSNKTHDNNTHIIYEVNPTKGRTRSGTRPKSIQNTQTNTKIDTTSHSIVYCIVLCYKICPHGRTAANASRQTTLLCRLR